MTAPSMARSPRIGHPRPDPRARHWTGVDLARRRALVIARQELEAAERREDPTALIQAWRDLVGVLARAELARLAEATDG